MVDLNAHEAGNGGKKPREAYSLPSLLYSEVPPYPARFLREWRSHIFLWMCIVPHIRLPKLPAGGNSTKRNVGANLK
jgi:hypothetical protein